MIDVSAVVQEIAGGFVAVSLVGMAGLFVYQLIGAIGYLKEMIGERMAVNQSDPWDDYDHVAENEALRARGYENLSKAERMQLDSWDESR